VLRFSWAISYFSVELESKIWEYSLSPSSGSIWWMTKSRRYIYQTPKSMLLPVGVICSRRVESIWREDLAYCDMTSESWSSPVLDNGLLKHVSVAMSGHAVLDELLGMVVCVRFASTYKGGHVIDSTVQFRRVHSWVSSVHLQVSRDSALSLKRIQKAVQ
jgi:hypothetical protein